LEEIMRRIALLAIVVGFFLPLLASAPANAQATRTWVSGVGDDANPCSRTAPCKTFAGSISKTAAGGEINCIDPGGFGALTITKAITISCEGLTAGVLVAGTNGFTVSAGVNDVVVLKGLDFEGVGSGIVGIQFNSGASLTVVNCTIRNFTSLGIGFNPTGNAALLVLDSLVTNNGTASSGGGIQVFPSGAGTAKALLNHVSVQRNFDGIAALGTSNLQIDNSTVSSNTSIGVIVAGVATIRIGRSGITNNGAAATSGNVLSYLDNQINGNNPDTTPTTAGGYH
jgi:Right handed beta helix region